MKIETTAKVPHLTIQKQLAEYRAARCDVLNKLEELETTMQNKSPEEYNAFIAAYNTVHSVLLKGEDIKSKKCVAHDLIKLVLCHRAHSSGYICTAPVDVDIRRCDNVLVVADTDEDAAQFVAEVESVATVNTASPVYHFMTYLTQSFHRGHIIGKVTVEQYFDDSECDGEVKE